MENTFRKQSNADVGLIYDFISSKNIGDTITYDGINEICVKTKDIQTERGAFNSARKKLETEKGIYLQVITNVGYKILSDEEKIHRQPKRFVGVRKTLSKSISELESVDSKNLTKDLHNQKQAYQAQAMVIKEFAKPKTTGRLLQKAMNNKLPSLPEDFKKLVEI